MSPPAGYSPRSRLEKLGLKPGSSVVLLGLDEPAFLRELSKAGITPRTRVTRDTAMILVAVTGPRGLARLATLERTMPRDGAVWAVWPKGRRELTENHIRDAALAAGLVDIKVIAFSDTLSGLKLVIPKARR